MGQAKLKGKTFEERKAFAIERDRIKPFPHVNIIEPKRKPRMPAGLVAFWTIVAMAERDAERQRAFGGPVKNKLK